MLVAHLFEFLGSNFWNNEQDLFFEREQRMTMMSTLMTDSIVSAALHASTQKTATCSTRRKPFSVAEGHLSSGTLASLYIDSSTNLSTDGTHLDQYLVVATSTRHS